MAQAAAHVAFFLASKLHKHQPQGLPWFGLNEVDFLIGRVVSPRQHVMKSIRPQFRREGAHDAIDAGIVVIGAGKEAGFAVFAINIGFRAGGGGDAAKGVARLLEIAVRFETERAGVADGAFDQLARTGRMEADALGGR